MTDERDIRALTDIEAVDRINEMSWAVHSVNCEDPYVVDDLVDGGWDCGCGDAKHRGAHCKHIRRVEMEIGERKEPMLTLGDFTGGAL